MVRRGHARWAAQGPVDARRRAGALGEFVGTAAPHAGVWARAGLAALGIPRPRPPRLCGILRELREELSDSWVSDGFLPSPVALLYSSSTLGHFHRVSTRHTRTPPPPHRPIALDVAMELASGTPSIVAAWPAGAPLRCAALALGSAGTTRDRRVYVSFRACPAVAAAWPPPAQGATQSWTLASSVGGGGWVAVLHAPRAHARPRPPRRRRARALRTTAVGTRRVGAGDRPRRRRRRVPPPPPPTARGAARGVRCARVRAAPARAAACRTAARASRGRRVAVGCRTRARRPPQTPCWSLGPAVPSRLCLSLCL